MNKSMIAYILGWILKLEGLFMLIPILVAVIYREHNGRVVCHRGSLCTGIWSSCYA